MSVSVSVSVLIQALKVFFFRFIFHVNCSKIGQTIKKVFTTKLIIKETENAYWALGDEQNEKNESGSTTGVAFQLYNVFRIRLVNQGLVFTFQPLKTKLTLLFAVYTCSKNKAIGTEH